MNLQENIQRIKEVMGINETFDKGGDPVLKNTFKNSDKKVFIYTLPSKKSDEDYIIKLTLYKKSPIYEGEFSNLKNVAQLDFNLGVGFNNYTGLHEIYYLFSSLNKIIDKHKNEFKYFIVYSTEDRLSLYEKVLSRINYLSLLEKKGYRLLYENKSYSKWFFKL